MESIRVVLTSQSCVAGGTVSGEVILNYPLLQQEQIDEVYLKFKGSVYTYASQSPPSQNCISWDTQIHQSRSDRLERDEGRRHHPGSGACMV